MVAHKAACHALSKGINEDMVQNLLMLAVLFTQESEVENLFGGAPSHSEPSLFLAITSGLRLKPV